MTKVSIFFAIVSFVISGRGASFKISEDFLTMTASDSKPFEYKISGGSWAYKKINPTTHTFTGKYEVADVMTVEEKFVVRHLAGESSVMSNMANYKYKSGEIKFITTSTDFDGYIQRCTSSGPPNVSALDCNLITPAICQAYQTAYKDMSDDEKLKCQSVIDLVQFRKAEAVKKYSKVAQDHAKLTVGATLGKISYNVQGFDPLDDATNCVKLAENKGFPPELYNFKAIGDKDGGKIQDQRDALSPEKTGR